MYLLPIDSLLRTCITVVYEALADPEDNMFTTGTISDMDKAERKLLEMEGWSTHCAKAHRFSNASDTRCASPFSLLRFLRPNNKLEQVGSRS